MESIEYKGTKTDFVKMALECKMPWETLTLILNDLAPTLNKIREFISILLKELVGLQLALKEKDKKLEMYQNSGSSEDTQYITLQTELQSSVIETDSTCQTEAISRQRHQQNQSAVSFLHFDLD